MKFEGWAMRNLVVVGIKCKSVNTCVIVVSVSLYTSWSA